MPLSQAQAQSFLNSIFGSSTPTTWYLALFFTDPTGTMIGNEMAGDTYARVPIPNTGAGFTGASATYPSVVNNATTLTFSTPGANWGTLGFWGIISSSTGGTPTWYGPFSSPLVVTSGNPVVINAGNLNLSLG